MTSNPECQQEYPEYHRCSECGARIKSGDKFYNGVIHASNGNFIYTVRSCHIR